MDRLRLFSIALSLGGVESLVTQPITTTHHGLSAAERAARNIPDSMIRLSVGLEDADDLIKDLAQALDLRKSVSRACCDVRFSFARVSEESI